MVAEKSAQIVINSRESRTDLASILANATESDLSALVEYAQQDSHIDNETPRNIESTGNGSSSNRSQDLNLDQIKSILASIDPIILEQLLVEILKE